MIWVTQVPRRDTMTANMRREGSTHMTHGRIETTPSEQLVALRKARDHYVALADELRDRVGSSETSDETLERDARRIANAYEKSVANMTAELARMGQPRDRASLFDNLGMARPIFAALVGGAALFALVYSGGFSIGSSHAPPGPRMANAPIRASAQAAWEAQSIPQLNQTAPMIPELPPAIPVARPHVEALRPTPVMEQTRPHMRLPKAANRSPGTTPRDDGGFVAKVLQPDGTFKEEYFPAPR